jgi:CO/xanthine dehydrogenase Mo-binding subunit
MTQRVLGESAPRIDGAEKVTGATEYTNDLEMEGLLWGRSLRSPYPHARIVHLDTSAAAALPGVHVVLTGQDVGTIFHGRGMRDVPVIPKDRVRFVGDRVATVAAETLEIAKRAVELIDVRYEPLPAVFDAVEATREGSPIMHPVFNDYVNIPKPQDTPSNVFARDAWSRGDVEAGFAASDIIVEETFEVPRVHHGYMEPNACVVRVDDDGRVQIWASNKRPYDLKYALAGSLDIPVESIRINPVAIGGDFGGKGSLLEVPLCYYLALHTGRPVKIALDYTEELTAGSPRHAGVLELKTGVMNDGTLVAHQSRVVFDSGAYGGHRRAPNLTSTFHAIGPYRIPHLSHEVLRVYTNNVSGGQMRAPGEPQGRFAAESHIDTIARRVGMDPLDFRRLNLAGDGEESASDRQYEDVRVKEVLEAAVEAADYGAPKAAGVGRGIAIGHRGPGTGETWAEVELGRDGTVTVRTPLFEQGSGTYTTLGQIVAEELQIPLSRVRVKVWDTDAVPFDSGVGGSSVTRKISHVGYEGSKVVRQALIELAADAFACPQDRVQLTGGLLRNSDSGATRTWEELVAAMPEPLIRRVDHPNPGAATVTGFTAQVAEVEVDAETGAVRLVRLTSAHDVGRILNPMGHQGQINGGVMMGVGYGLIEDLPLEEGRVIGPTLVDYKLPAIGDIPELRTVLVPAEVGAGPYNTKGIGENPIVPVAAAIANAVEDAVGVRIRRLPVTAERVYRMLTEGR